MRFLLDTHAVLWALTDPDRLGQEAFRIIRDPESRLVVSAVTAWEMSTKQRLGKLPQADALVGAYERHLDRLGSARLPITDDHALLAGSLDWDHRDPFDRMLAAQAMIESLTLISADRRFIGLRGVPVAW